MGEISERTLNALNVLEYELAQVDGFDEHAVFGSASLALREIIDRAPADIDVLVTERVWGQLLARPRWGWSTPNAGDPPILVAEFLGPPIHLFFDWRDHHVTIDVRREIATAEEVECEGMSFRCTLVENVIAHKQGALTWPREQWEAHGLLGKMERHASDIEACQQALRS